MWRDEEGELKVNAVDNLNGDCCDWLQIWSGAKDSSA